ncbi:flavin reductase family protein [Streptomyces sp. NPDC055134]
MFSKVVGDAQDAFGAGDVDLQAGGELLAALQLDGEQATALQGSDGHDLVELGGGHRLVTTPATGAEHAVDQRLFRDVMGHLPTGVVAIAGLEADTRRPSGMIVGTFQALSLTPALVTFSVDRSSTSWPEIRTTGRFSATVLAEHQTDVCKALSRIGLTRD